MRKSLVICAHEASSLAAVHPRLVEQYSHEFIIASIDCPRALGEQLEELAGQATPVAVVAVSEAWASDGGWMDTLQAKLSTASLVWLPAAKPDAPLHPDVVLSRLRDPVQTHLLRLELEAQKRALELRNQQLESLNDVGTAMSGSFDIGFILEQIHRAVSRLVGNIPIDVFYAGSVAINARPRWHPITSTIDGSLTETERMRLESKVSLAAEKMRSQSPEEEPPNLEAVLHKFDRIAIPIAYKEDLLGMVLFKSQSPPTPETARFLSILNLQAATALRNIHLTQERIQFERLAAFGRMIGSLVHDFRSPLTAVRGYAGMLTNSQLGDEDRSTYGKYLLEECDRLNGMIHELLEFTRGRQSSLSISRFSLEGFLSAIPTRVAAQYPRRSIEVRLELGYGGEMAADRDRLDRALWNVLNNACQALPPHGRIIIQTRRQRDRVFIAVTDNGPGIPEAIRHRIFEPFFSYGKVEGIGLGMAITGRIVEEHGGSIHIDSTPGRGTKVVFEIPVQEESSSLEQPSHPVSREMVRGA